MYQTQMLQQTILNEINMYLINNNCLGKTCARIHVHSVLFTDAFTHDTYLELILLIITMIAYRKIAQINTPSDVNDS